MQELTNYLITHMAKIEGKARWRQEALVEKEPPNPTPAALADASHVRLHTNVPTWQHHGAFLCLPRL